LTVQVNWNIILTNRSRLMRKVEDRSLFKRLEGYILIPHELLHVMGYRLVGQQCKYQWGQSYVTPVRPISRYRDLLGMLFPFLIFSILLIIFALFTGFASEAVVREASSFWFIFWLTLTYTAAIYIGTTLGDLRRAYLLFFNKPWYGWTPFDFFFQPLVDWNEIRRKVAAGEIDDQQD
jgi:hypothetical protein